MPTFLIQPGHWWLPDKDMVPQHEPLHLTLCLCTCYSLFRNTFPGPLTSISPIYPSGLSMHLDFIKMKSSCSPWDLDIRSEPTLSIFFYQFTETLDHRIFFIHCFIHSTDMTPPYWRGYNVLHLGIESWDTNRYDPCSNTERSITLIIAQVEVRLQTEKSGQRKARWFYENIYKKSPWCKLY